VTRVTSTSPCIAYHCGDISDNTIRKGEIMLCSELPPRIHESLEILVCLAHEPGPSHAQEIAGKAELPPAQTAKILQSLAWAGFVESRRGAKGGFWLAQPAERIRAAEVIDFLSRRSRGRSQEQRDPLARALARVLARCQKAFDEITIADLARAVSCKPRGVSRSGRKTRRVQGRQETVPAIRKRASAVRGAKS